MYIVRLKSSVYSETRWWSGKFTEGELFRSRKALNIDSMFGFGDNGMYIQIQSFLKETNGVVLIRSFIHHVLELVYEFHFCCVRVQLGATCGAGCSDEAGRSLSREEVLFTGHHSVHVRTIVVVGCQGMAPPELIEGLDRLQLESSAVLRVAVLLDDLLQQTFLMPTRVPPSRPGFSDQGLPPQPTNDLHEQEDVKAFESVVVRRTLA